MEVNQKFHDLNTDGVLLDPEWQPSQLKLRIQVAQHSWQGNLEHLQSVLDEEPPAPPHEELDTLEAALHQELWKDIPREAMPHFKPMNSNSEETEDQVGDYTLGPKLEARCGIVREATDKQNRRFAIKVICKDEVFTPFHLEAIWREFRLLAGFVKHPNIVRSIACFHGPKNVYTILEFLGGQNLSNFLSGLPGLRVNKDDAMSYFSQIASAVSHCHQKDVTHRTVCLEHVVMKHTADSIHMPNLVDFRSAVTAEKDVPFLAACGTLPCMSPEMVCEAPYLPKLADCWSVGVVLLEMAGGKGSFCRALNLDETSGKEMHASGNAANIKMLADQILNFFGTAGNHAVALAWMGGVENQQIQSIIESLLQPEGRRSTLDSFVVDQEIVDDEHQDAPT